jgi:bacteriocin biosynthesis cyclodehydratase domain-containing protein
MKPEYLEGIEPHLRNFFLDPNINFPQLPRLLEDIFLFNMPNGLGFQIHGGPTAILLRGREASRIYDFLLPLLDGSHTLDEILESCSADISINTAAKALSLFHTKGLLVNSGLTGDYTVEFPIDPSINRQLLFWGRNLGLTGANNWSSEAQNKICLARIVLLGTGLFGLSAFDLLSRSGFSKINVMDFNDDGFMLRSIEGLSVSPELSTHHPKSSIDDVIQSLRKMLNGTDIVVVATRNAPEKLFLAINRICLDQDCPVIFSNDNGNHFEIGPLVMPYRSACYKCLELRNSSVQDLALENHLYQEHLVLEHQAGMSPLKGESLVVATLGASLLVMEVIRIITQLELPILLNKLQTVNPMSGGHKINRILRYPRCPDCSRSNES